MVAMLPSADEFVAIHAFERLATWCSKRTREYAQQEAQDHPIVYRRSDWDQFFRDVHATIGEPYVLLSSYHDSPVDRYYTQLDDERLVAWFANNVQIRHPKVHCIPLGIKDAAVAGLNKACRPESRDVLLYLNFKPHQVVRQQLIERFAIQSWCLCRKHDITSPNIFYEDLYRSHFVASPRGHGQDCYRTWEALAAGCIPIVQSSFLDPLYTDLPVLIVADWQDVTEDLLQETLTDFASRAFHWDRLRMDWWNELIRSYT